MAVRELVIKDLSADLHDELMHFFDVIAFADNPHWARCFCSFFLSNTVDEYEARAREHNRAIRSDVIRSGRANGLVAYRLGRVVGWCHAAPKNELPLLASWDPANTRDEKTGAVVCFMVAPDARRQGLATNLLHAACDYLRRRGMTAVEAYPPLTSPEDPTVWPRRNYHGPLSMFVKAGFEEVSRNEWAITVRKAL